MATTPTNEDRFIPACAGNISKCSPVIGRSSVYPRMRGEHTSKGRSLLSSSGLSPHARGTCLQGGTELGNVRFIPACAGNIPLPVQSVFSDSVYPRMRGEHFMGFHMIQHPSGLSPHARGTYKYSHSGLQRHRFIPACAGNILRLQLHALPPSVYPRMRGEHIDIV